MNFGRIITADCVNSAPPIDERCSDPAFALAHPEICPVEPSLIIKPGLALACALYGSVQFRAFKVINGVEQDVSSETIFSTSSADVVVVGAASGNATGVAAGDATITATYQGIQAHAAVTVIGTGAQENCCDEITVAIVAVLDVTKSMGLGFSGGLTRLGYGRTAIKSFISGMNDTKDMAGLIRFHKEEVEVVQSLTFDLAAVGALVDTVSQTQQMTTFYDALVQAVAELDASSADRKVILLVSDGEDTSDTYLSGGNPLEVAEGFKNLGGIIMCLGVRAHGKGYNLLSRLATGGMFLNAVPSNSTAAMAYLNGLRGYVCGGNCSPAGNVYEATPALEYTGFANWTVTGGGSVDLIGKGLMDHIPSAALYVNLRSLAQAATDDSLAVMTTTAGIALAADSKYRLSVELAGNQIIDATPYKAFVEIFYLDGTGVEQTILNQIINVTDHKQPFNTYTYIIQPSYAGTAYIRIGMDSLPYGVTPKTGLLLNEVKLTNLDTLETLFLDDFNTENMVFTPPKCGEVPGYDPGEDCYGDGCLEEPPPEQQPDPNPLPDAEQGSPPPGFWTSTKSATENCPAGWMNLTSLVPVMTGQTTPSGEVFGDIELPLGDPLWTVFSASPHTDALYAGSLETQLEEPVFGYVGYKFTSPTVISGFRFTGPIKAFKRTILSLEASANGTSWTVLGTFIHEQPGFLPPNNFHAIPYDPIAARFTNTTAYTYYRLGMRYEWSLAAPKGIHSSNSLIGSVEFYGNSASVTATATATSEISQVDADTKATAAARAAATEQLNCSQSWTKTASHPLNCPWYQVGPPVVGTGTYTSLISEDDAETKATALAIADAQSKLSCGGSNNDQPIIINQFGAATPYPSVQTVEGFSGVPSKITCVLHGVKHTWIEDVHVLLRAPNGQYLLLMAKNVGSYDVGSASFPSPTWTFDDDAAGPLPYDMPSPATYANWQTGTYQPSGLSGKPGFAAIIPTLNPYFPLPAEQDGAAYLTTFAALLATMAPGDANGPWCLFVYDASENLAGRILRWEVILTP